MGRKSLLGNFMEGSVQCLHQARAAGSSVDTMDLLDMPYALGLTALASSVWGGNLWQAHCADTWFHLWEAE